MTLKRQRQRKEKEDGKRKKQYRRLFQLQSGDEEYRGWWPRALSERPVSLDHCGD